MKMITLPPPVRGLDVRSPETELPRGAVRSASNVVLSDTGAVRRAPGSVLRGALSGAHSLWKGENATLVAAGNTLYEATLGNPTTYEAIFTGLPYDEPVEYDEVGDTVYFTSGDVLGKLCSDGLVRRPGVAELIGHSPTLAETVGGLYPGTYLVAYSLTNDLGEESPLSAIASIELASGGGILVTNTVNATDVTTLNVYVSAANGSELYLNQSIDWATMTTVNDQYAGRQASKQGRVVMPGGSIVRHWNGRLVVAVGSFVVISEPFDYGVTDPRAGWLSVGETITMMEAVAGGLFVGTATRVVFYTGGGPEDAKVVTTSRHGAHAHSGLLVAPDFFDPKVANTALPAAVWLSDVGLMAGTAEGHILPLQADRIRLTSDGIVRPSAVWNGGVKQVLFSVESMTMGVGSSADGTP